MIALVLAVLAQPGNPDVRPGWSRFVPPGGGYSILMPAQPIVKRRKSLGRSESGGKLYSMTAATFSEGVTYEIHYSDNLPMTAAERSRFLGGFDQVNNMTGFRLLDERKIEVDGHPGRDTTIQWTEGRPPEPILTRRRDFLIGNRSVLVAAAINRANWPARAADIEAFLDSFRIEPERLGNKDGKKENSWKPFHSDAGKFSILMPREPQKTVLQAPTDYGPSEVTWYIYKGRTGVLSASFMDYPEAAANVDRATLMEKGIVGTVQKLRGELIAERKVKAGDQPGRELIIAVPQGMHQAIPNGGIYRVRAFQVGRRLYQVVAVVPQELADSRDINRFFASFTLANAKTSGKDAKDGDDESKKQSQGRKR